MTKLRNIDFENMAMEAIKKLQNGEELSGKDGALTPLIKSIIEAALEGELAHHLEQDPEPNRKNGKARKTLKTAYGPIDIEPSRDRNGTFEPMLIKKNQRTLGKYLDQKIINLISHGMSQGDISTHIETLYGIEVSKSLISHISDQTIPKIKEWQNRSLQKAYALVWMDASHHNVRDEGHVESKAAYSLVGLDLHGKKELLGIYISKSESASQWLTILNSIRSRGVEDIFIASIDNLAGFKKAIKAVYSKTKIQHCVVHQVRNSVQYISTKDKKPFLNDLKAIYRASDINSAELHLQALKENWGKKYGHVVKSWEANWPELSAYFQFPVEIRKIMYTTNTIESFHSQLRKITKTKRVFPSDMALMKVFYLAQENITKKWDRTLPHWGQILSHFCIIFGERLEKYLDLGTYS